MAYFQINRQQLRDQGLSDADIDANIARRKAKGDVISEIGATPTPSQPTIPQPPITGATTEPKTGGMLDYLPMAGGVLGGIGGGIVGTAVAPGAGTIGGGVAGAGAGQAMGEALRQYLTPEKDTDAKKIVKEGVIGAGSELLGAGIGQVAAKTLRPLAKGAAKWAAPRVARFSQPMMAAFKKETGEVLSDFLTRSGLVTKNADEVMELISPLAKQHEEKLLTSGANVDVDTIIRAFEEPIAKLSKSTSPGYAAKVAEITQARDNLIKSAKDGLVDIGQLLADKRAYYDQAGNLLRQGVKSSPDEITANTILGLINSAADRTGIQLGDMSIAQAGKELQKLTKLQELLLKREDFGAGNLPIGLLQTIGMAGGLGVGGIGGMSVPFVLGQLANTQVGRKALAEGTQKLAGAQIPKIISDVLPRLASQGITSTATQQPSVTQTKKESVLPSVSLETTQATKPTMPPEVTAELNRIGTIKSAAGQEQAMKLLKLKYPEWAAQAKGKGTGYTSGQEKELSDIKVAQSLLGDLDRENAEVSVSGPIMGRLASLNPYSTTAQGYNARLKLTKQIIGKALEGGVLRKEDEAKYAYILPQINDTAEVAQYKSDQLKKIISQQLQIKTGIYGGGSVLPEVNLAQ